MPEGTGIVLEEFKQLINERRFVMKSYMQALALYLALAGYGVKELLAGSAPFTPIVAGLFTALNVVAFYAAGRFRSMAVHATNREEELAHQLGIKGPHSLIWGYGSGIAVVVLYQIAVTLITVLKLRDGRPG